MKETTILIIILLSLNNLMATTDTLSISSKILNENRTIFISTPYGYDSDDKNSKYPLVILTDGEWHHDLVNNASKLLYQDGFPKVVIASIENTDRSRDLTISNTQESPTSGGASEFYKFVNEELIPNLKNNYQISNHLSFLGHSAGGLFATYTLIQKDNPFSAFVAVTPTIRWDNFKIINEFDSSLRQKLSEEDISFFLSIGNETGNERQGVIKLDSILASTYSSKFDYNFLEYKQDSHAIVPWKAYFDGLKFIYRSFHIPEAYNNKAFSFTISYYEDLGKKFDYDTRVPQRIILNRGYETLKVDKSDAVEIFTYYTKVYPEIPIPHSLLGDIYFEQKKYAQSKKHFEKAFELFPTQYVKDRLTTLKKLMN